MLLLAIVIFLLILIVVLILDMRNASDIEGFYSDNRDPDRVLKASYVVGHQSDLPPNLVIHKGFNSEYWDCYEMQRSLGTPENEILSRCKKFI